MLLYIYIGTTAYVWYSSIKSLVKMDKRLKKEGYVFVQKSFGPADIFIATMGLVALSIPVLHLIFPLASYDKEEAYMWYKDKLLEDGAIEKHHVDVEDLNAENNINNYNMLYEVDNKKQLSQSFRVKFLPRDFDEEINDIKQEKEKTYKKEFFQKRR